MPLPNILIFLNVILKNRSTIWWRNSLIANKTE